MRTTIYLPDELGQRVNDAGLSISPICRAALHEELRRMDTIAATRGEMEEILVDLLKDGTAYQGRFRGTWLVFPDEDNHYMGGNWDSSLYWGVALTEKGRIAVYTRHARDAVDPTITTFDTLEKASKALPPMLYAEVAVALGKPGVVDLDI